MPFIGISNGQEVWPDSVNSDERVECPACGEMMHVRRSHTTTDGVFRPCHFVHDPDGVNCGGGESDEHKLMKYVVSRRLNELFDHATVAREVNLGERRVDVLAEFDEPIFPLGNGIAAEVQYKNEDKNVAEVTNEYLQHGFSVCWLDEDDFGASYSVQLPDLIRLWPNAVPDIGGDPSEHAEKYLDDIKPAKPSISIIPPYELVDQHEDELRAYWELGSGRLSYDVCRELSDNNASRPCSECGADADFYCYKNNLVSEFRCIDHLRATKLD